MNLKKTIKMTSMILFMVFAISSVTEYSFAYWASNVTPPTNTSTEGVASIGAWQTVPQWTAGTTYVIGDRVVNNGIIYEAKKNNPTRQPGVDSGWNSEWLQIGPA